MKHSAWETIKELLYMYWTMFQIGICTFGGGYAMISIIERELVEKRKWISSDELLDYVAIGQTSSQRKSMRSQRN